MRIGTLAHEDLQNALVYYNNIINKEINNKETIKNKEKENKNKEKEIEFHIEGELSIPELNVRGFYDVVVEQNLPERKGYLYDNKT